MMNQTPVYGTQQDAWSKMRHVGWLTRSTTQPPDTHLRRCPLCLHDIIIASSHSQKKKCLGGTLTVRSRPAQTYSPEPAVPAHTCFLFAAKRWAVRGKEGGGQAQSGCARGGTACGDWAQSRRLPPEPHITRPCGKPRFHHTLRHPANHSTIVWSYGEGGAFILEKFTDIGYLCWPERQ